MLCRQATQYNKSLTHLEVLCNFTNQPLEGELPDEELCRLRVATNFTEGDGTGAEAMRLLDTTGRGCSGSLACSGLGSELLTGGLALKRKSENGEVLEDGKGNLPPVDLRAVCLVRAIANF